MSHSVYWIYAPGHTDPKKQGYVGKTDMDVKKRVSIHESDNLTVGKKMRELKGTWDYKTLHSGLTLKEAKELEKYYRPHGTEIGWNDKGGG